MPRTLTSSEKESNFDQGDHNSSTENNETDSRLYSALSLAAKQAQKQAIFLIARTTLRMEGRRAALRWLCAHTGEDYNSADDMVLSLVEHMRSDPQATEARQVWAREMLLRDTIPAEGASGQPLPEPVVALVARISEVVDKEVETIMARWAQFGPTAIRARERLAIEQFAVTGPLFERHRITILADLAAVTEGLHLATARLIEQQPQEEKSSLQAGCQNTASQDLAILCGQERYRNQLVAWANGVAMDVDPPAPVEIRSVAPRKSEGRLRGP